MKSKRFPVPTVPPRLPLMPKIIICLMALLFFCIGWGGLYWNLSSAAKARNWVQVQGTVKSSSVARSQSHSRHGSHTVYRPLVVYDYDYQGKKYQNNRFATFNVSTSSYQAQKAKVDRYHPGDKVQIWVDPGKPQSSVLERQTRPPLFMLLFFSLFGLVGTGLMVFAVKKVFVRQQVAPDRCLILEKLQPSFPATDKAMVFFAVLWNLILVVIGSFFCFSEGKAAWEVKTGKIGLEMVMPLLVMSVFVIVGICFAVKAVRKLWRFHVQSRCEVVVTCSAVRSGEKMQVDYTFAPGTEIKWLGVSVKSVNQDMRTMRKNDPDPAQGIEQDVWESGESGMVSPVGSFSFDLPEVPPANERRWSLLFEQEDSQGRTSATEYKIC